MTRNANANSIACSCAVLPLCCFFKHGTHTTHRPRRLAMWGSLTARCRFRVTAPRRHRCSATPINNPMQLTSTPRPLHCSHSAGIHHSVTLPHIPMSHAYASNLHTTSRPPHVQEHLAARLDPQASLQRASVQQQPPPSQREGARGSRARRPTTCTLPATLRVRSRLRVRVQRRWATTTAGW
jgi:hypothetical protein